MKGDAVRLVSLQTIEGARHVLLLKDFVVGYKTFHGDDTYPLLTDWRTEATVRLHPALYNHHADQLIGDIHVCPNLLICNAVLNHNLKTPCHAMGIWRDCLFLVFDCSIEIFSLSMIEFPAMGSADRMGRQSLSLPSLRVDGCGGWIGEAYIYDASQVSGTMDQSLHLSIRDRRGYQYVRTIVQSQDGSFSWDTDFPKEPGFVKAKTYMHCIGVSTEYQLRLVSEDIPTFYPAALELTRHPRSLDAETGLCPRYGERQKFIICSHNLPILDLTTAMDFDDGAGVILLGSCRGEISIIQFVDRSTQVPGSVPDDLPTVKYDLPDLETVRSHCF